MFELDINFKADENWEVVNASILAVMDAFKFEEVGSGIERGADGYGYRDIQFSVNQYSLRLEHALVDALEDATGMEVLYNTKYDVPEGYICFKLVCAECWSNIDRKTFTCPECK